METVMTRPERKADRHLLLARRRAGEQKVGEIGDDQKQEQESHDRE